MSAHVVPKAKPFPDDEPEEKTTLESQWEEEASTTVEQGDVADKVRALGIEPRARVITNVTSTGERDLEESTVDDQRANPVIAQLPTPAADQARLVITQGSDTGRDLAIRPGQTYTIGRGLDNDLVLTDIAVSRKHFDLRHERGAWVIVDRGSGNGTIVNGNLEDNPFMLANGDSIEIGNTMFRFEQANGAPRAAPSFDDEELSTVAGKAMQRDPLEAETPVAAPLPLLEARERPRTAPPPMRAAASAPPYAAMPPPQAMAPATTLPMPQMAVAGRPHVLAPAQPTMLGEGMMPTTLPGQGPVRPTSYPKATEIPPHSVHAQMLQIAAQQGGRHDPSTAMVQPTPYLAMPPGAQLRQYVQPQLSKRSKMMLAGAALSALAAIVTVAIIKSGGPRQDHTAQAKGSATAPDVQPLHAAPAIAPPAPAPAVATTGSAAAAQARAPAIVQAPPTPAPAPTHVEPPRAPVHAAHEVAHVEPAHTAVRPAPPRPAPRPQPKPNVAASRPHHASVAPPAPRHVAAATDIDAVLARADQQYRAKHFDDAENLLASAARDASDSDARQLRHRADLYEKFKRAYYVATAPATPAVEAYERAREAINYDGPLGRAFDNELKAKLAQVAPRVAITYVAKHDYKDAHTAVAVAESTGGQNVDTRLVRDQLEKNARETYGQAEREKDSNPSDARTKCRNVLDWVDGSSTWYARAKKLLQQLGT